MDINRKTSLGFLWKFAKGRKIKIHSKGCSSKIIVTLTWLRSIAEAWGDLSFFLRQKLYVSQVSGRASWHI